MDVTELRTVTQPQVTHETVAANDEAPRPVWNRTRQLHAHEPAVENAHLLFASVHDLARVDRHAVCRRACDAIDDTLVVARRRSHETKGCAAPNADCARGCRPCL